ncbi:hypothetical protein [Brevibacillus panacihumi]|uniref:Uncharacterized protein n=1 Tax=Brevibacillus panacihumi TaxID=497735 RepID=A0A3M8DE51_9BACL|nr:hypothetical protein [Brevibacillus panacihumi]RNB86440.1 hypothetical protein EDM58_02570 [Brevibacillus panacihumi]
MLRRLLSALLSSIIFCVILAYLQHTPVAERQPSTSYMSFSSLVFIYLIYATPVYLLGGIPCSILIDTITKRIFRRSSIIFYLVNIICYALAGMLLILLLFSLTKIKEWIWLGAAPALLYYVVYLLVRLLIRKPQSINYPWEEGGKKMG